MACYTTRAARAGCIAIAMTSVPPAMRTYNGTRPFFGTNPIAVAALRAGAASPFSLDMATTAMANGKLTRTAQSGRPLPAGVVHRADGSSITDPAEFLADRATFTEAIGIDPPGPAAAHKGFGLAAAVEVFCAVLAGQKLGRENLGPDPTKRDDEAAAAEWAQWFMVMATDPVQTQEDFEQQLGRLTAAIHAEPARDPRNPPMLPGDPEEREAMARATNGIPLSRADLDNLTALAKQLGLTMPSTSADIEAKL